MSNSNGWESPALLNCDRQILKEIPYPQCLDYEMVRRWSENIPVFSDDPELPEWRPTPVIELDLSTEGLGRVFVKNEADRMSNPTGTIKDRAAWEIATVYRDFAISLMTKIRAGLLTKKELETIPVPRFSVITAGNEGRALANCFEVYDLPPPKLLIGNKTNTRVLEKLLELRADIYSADLSQPLDPETIRLSTNNPGGIDITSIKPIEPWSVFYDWHVHEAFNLSPNRIYLPYGSGRLMENYLTWQVRSVRNEVEGRRDPRLKVPIADVVTIDIFGAEPAEASTIADKLFAPCRPFALYTNEDTSTTTRLALGGDSSSIVKVPEPDIVSAYGLLNAYGIPAEPSGAAGLALYINHFQRGLVRPEEKVLVVNTGFGLQA
ncbi:hypothetical protein A3F65_03445 [Candidatus Saccharibacteria bacterium RIFCSPHIGHO2_12_FULL_47_16b]|nr:MAG: hypothetical protein A3F65_03445 [Candidatus Saccharibacteria bacterium RIFCSPHIGHO2_12_FULL_47_16b]